MALHHFTLPVAGLLALWIGFSVLARRLFPTPAQLKRKRITFLIGHPDDEAMFFGPSILALVAPNLGNDVRIICLSTGNATGEGQIRRTELLHSARRLGIRSASQVDVVEDSRFQDGPIEWKATDIASFLKSHFATDADKASHDTSSPNGEAAKPTRRRNQQPEDQTATAKAPLPEVIITFDPQGVSRHPNHTSCYHGAVQYLNNFSNLYPASTTAPLLYVLPSLPKWRKYIHIFDVPLTLLSAQTPNAVFLSDLSLYLSAFGAMVKAHQTQMVWFRWGWILTGRYMMLNELVRVEIPTTGGDRKGQ